MATAPKAVPDATPPEAGEVPAPKKSKKMLFIIIGVVVLALAGGGGAWFFMGGKHKAKAAKTTAVEGKIDAGDKKDAEANTDGTDPEAADKEGADGEEAAKEADATEEGHAPVFVVIEPFTVNLQSETGTDQFLQISFTLQVSDAKTQDLIKLYMPQVRSRMLMLLSSKKSSELTSTDGKKKLSDEIVAQVKQSFSPKGSPQAVINVFFTSFVIQ